jgi:hypothetical protein
MKAYLCRIGCASSEHRGARAREETMAERAQMCSTCGLVFETEAQLRQHEAEAHASKETPTDPQREPA